MHHFAILVPSNFRFYNANQTVLKKGVKIPYDKHEVVNYIVWWYFFEENCLILLIILLLVKNLIPDKKL